MISSIRADIPYKDCGSKVGTIIYFNVSRCTSSPCKFTKGPNDTVVLVFMSKAPSKTATPNLYGNERLNVFSVCHYSSLKWELLVEFQCHFHFLKTIFVRWMSHVQSIPVMNWLLPSMSNSKSLQQIWKKTMSAWFFQPLLPVDEFERRVLSNKISFSSCSSIKINIRDSYLSFCSFHS